jgi:hypothetical protein
MEERRWTLGQDKRKLGWFTLKISRFFIEGTVTAMVLSSRIGES